jgi:hypothetical protein
VFNFQQTQMTKGVCFSLINKTLPYIAYSNGRYQNETSTYKRTNFVSFVEIIGFQRLRLNISKVQNIRTLHLQLSLFTLKYTTSSCLCAVDVSNNQFVVAHLILIYLNGVSYTRFEQAVGRNFSCNNVHVWGVGCYLWVFTLS